MAFWMTGLDRVAKSTGRKVVLVDGWEKRGHGPMNSVTSIICHHTAGPNNGKNYPSLGTVQNGRPGIAGPLAQIGIGRDGTIYVIASGVAYHAGKVASTKHNNWNAIGIEAENNGVGEKWGDEIMESYVLFVRALVDEFKLPLSAVLGHKEVAVPKGRKIDPSFDMDEFRKAVKRGYWKEKSGSKPAPETTKPSGNKPAPSKPVSKEKTVKQMAEEVIAGKHGNGHEARQKSLGVSNAVYAKVRDEVNARAGVKAPAKPKGKTVAQMATEVIAGKHGNGHPQRQKSLGVNAATYAKVRAEVNKRV